MAVATPPAGPRLAAAETHPVGQAGRPARTNRSQHGGAGQSNSWQAAATLLTRGLLCNLSQSTIYSTRIEGQASACFSGVFCRRAIARFGG